MRKFFASLLKRLADATIYRNVTRPEVVRRLTYGNADKETDLAS